MTHDGRTLAVDLTGDLTGWPVFLLHGTPGSRSGPIPRGSVLSRLGVQLISYDRPGYGGSTRHPGRRVADAASDVAAIADALELDHFSVIGRSGGGPHALACTALLSGRVARTAVLVGLAPSDAPGLEWFEGMTDANVREFSEADTDESMLVERLRLRSEQARHDPESLLDLLRSQMTATDIRVVDAVEIRKLLAASYGEALAAGPYGWIDDVLALRGTWGFLLGSINTPVRLWHGADDNFAPASHAVWLAGQIPDAEIQVEANTAHFGAVEALPNILAWSIGAADGILDARR